MSAASRDIRRIQALLTGSPMLAQGLCVTAVDVGADDAVARYGGIGLGEPLTPEQALDLVTLAYPRHLALAVVVARPPWTLVVDPSGTHGTQPETLHRLSDGATAVNVFWNINLRTRCRYWENQVELASFELLDDEPRPLADPRLERLRRGLTFDDVDRFKAEALVLLERLTGVWVDWMAASHPVAVVIDVDRFTFGDPRWQLSTRAPDLGDAELGELDSLAARAVDAACRIAGVDRRGLVEQPDALLARARELEGQHCIALVGSVRVWTTWSGWPPNAQGTRPEEVDPDEYLRQADAVAAVRARLADDVAERTAGALVHAINAVPGGWPQLRQSLDGA